MGRATICGGQELAWLETLQAQKARESEDRSTIDRLGAQNIKRLLVLVSGAKCPNLYGQSSREILRAASSSSFGLIQPAALAVSGISASGCGPGCPILLISPSLLLHDR